MVARYRALVNYLLEIVTFLWTLDSKFLASAAVTFTLE